MRGHETGVPWPYSLPAGSELKAFRTAIGVQQQDIAKAAGVTTRTVRKAETDPDGVTLGSLRAILGALAAHRNDA